MGLKWVRVRLKGVEYKYEEKKLNLEKMSFELRLCVLLRIADYQNINIGGYP